MGFMKRRVFIDTYGTPGPPAPTALQVKNAETRLQLWGHKVTRVGYYADRWKVDDEIVRSRQRLIDLSKGE